jgi:hypothetical protein
MQRERFSPEIVILSHNNPDRHIENFVIRRPVSLRKIECVHRIVARLSQPATKPPEQLSN